MGFCPVTLTTKIHLQNHLSSEQNIQDFLKVDYCKKIYPWLA